MHELVDELEQGGNADVDVIVPNEPPGWLVWRRDWRWGRKDEVWSVASIRLFQTDDQARTWANGCKDIVILPSDRVHPLASPASTHAVRQLNKR